jgi:hypothetical protein
MSSATAPYPYFNGITYNPSFFSSSTSTGITQTQANLLYLKKTTADMATALETFSGGVNSSSYDASDTAAGITALAIGSSVIHGNIVIGNAQTDGDIIIGASDASGATITVGTTSTATIINGTLSSSTGILSGQTALNIISANFTIPSTINRDYYLFCNTKATTYTITLPVRLANQYIRFRNYSGQTLTITAPTTTPATSIYPTFSTVSFSTTWPSFLNNTVLTLYCDGTNWLGF